MTLCKTSLAAWSAHTESNKANVLSQLSSARLSAQGCARAAADEKWDTCVESIATLNELLEKIKEILLKR